MMGRAQDNDPLGNTVCILNRGGSRVREQVTAVDDLFVTFDEPCTEEDGGAATHSVRATEEQRGQQEEGEGDREEAHVCVAAGRPEYDKTILETHFVRATDEEYAAQDSGSNAFGFECIHRRDGAALKTFVDNHECIAAVSDALGNTLITVAAYSGWLKAVKFFIKRGVDVNKVNSYGLSPLHYAIEFEHFDIRDYLIKKGAHVHG